MLDQATQDKVKDIVDRVFKVQVEVLDGGKLPCKAHITDAGFDLYAAEDVELRGGCIYKVPLNIRLALPEGTYMEITTKSGLGSKGMLVYAGIIDQEYRGIPHVICTKLTPSFFVTDIITIKKGDKIAQGIMHPFSPNYFIEQVEFINTDTSRGEGGFGSSGK